ncbi:hypothetical protein K2X05_02465, partial [bacterium]|nr:hypothetical protein [bacterium]
MDCAKFILGVLSLLIVWHNPAFAQMGPPISPPALLTVENLFSESDVQDGVSQQTMASTGFPIFKSDQLFL